LYTGYAGVSTDDEVDHEARLYNQDRLRTLALDRSKDVTLFCSHDAVELEAFAKQPSKIFN
jgi:hypothetical protein